MMKKLLFISFAIMFCGLFQSQIFAQMQEAQTNKPAKTDEPPTCQVIRTVNYPVTKTASKKVKPRIALLNLCPDKDKPASRPMLSMMINGEIKMYEYEVIRVFKNQKEADKYAKANKIEEPKS